MPHKESIEVRQRYRMKSKVLAAICFSNPILV